MVSLGVEQEGLIAVINEGIERQGKTLSQSSRGCTKIHDKIQRRLRQTGVFFWCDVVPACRPSSRDQVCAGSGRKFRCQVSPRGSSLPNNKFPGFSILVDTGPRGEPGQCLRDIIRSQGLQRCSDLYEATPIWIATKLAKYLMLFDSVDKPDAIHSSISQMERMETFSSLLEMILLAVLIRQCVLVRMTVLQEIGQSPRQFISQ